MIAEADPQTMSRLLALYPVSALKEKWPKHKKKDAILTWVPANVALKEIKDFLDEYFSCCKQHIYKFTHHNDITDLPNFRIPDAEKILDIQEDGTRRLLYVAEVEYHVVFTDPLREDRITFLWPIRLEFSKEHLIVRFVTLEKDLRAYFDESSRTVSRSLSETDVIRHLESVLTEMKPLDINKGVKHLWDIDRFDGVFNKFKKSKSTQTEAMTPGHGFKKDYPALYKTLKLAPLGPCAFRMDEESNDYSFGAFTADPTKGTLSFPTYSQARGDTDRFVAEILRNNK